MTAKQKLQEIIGKMVRKELKSLNEAKVYNEFSDKHGKIYKFDTYLEFAKFWFNLPYNYKKSSFPDNFKQLQNAAANSKEARTPYKN